MREWRLTFRKGDILAIAAVVVFAAVWAIACVSWDSLPSDVVVQVYQDSRLVKELPLDKNGIFQVSGSYRNTVEIRDGKVAVIASDCPGADCVHSGWIRTAGRSIVCLPNRVEIRIAGRSDVDIVVR